MLHGIKKKNAKQKKVITLHILLQENTKLRKTRALELYSASLNDTTHSNITATAFINIS